MNKKKLIHKGEWVSLFSRKTNTGIWEFVERNHQQPAAIVIGITPFKDIVLIEQHRQPFNKTVLEFPAGLIDKGETPEETALRELREETGCSGKVISVSPPIASSAGLTTETLYFVEVLITDTNGEQRLDDEEKIDWDLWALNNQTLKVLKRYAEKNDMIISSRLYAYLFGKI